MLFVGEEFGLLDGRVLCKSHYLEIVEGNLSVSLAEIIVFIFSHWIQVYLNIYDWFSMQTKKNEEFFPGMIQRVIFGWSE